MEIKKESNDYIIKLNNHEVLVFFEWLVKFVENNDNILLLNMYKGCFFMRFENKFD